MRLLSAAFAIGAALVASGCYEPSLTDCKFRCGPGGACPHGTTCTGGFCLESSSGSCPASPSDANNGDDATDGSPCPASPCGDPAVPVTGGCAVLCTQARTFNGALGVCDRDTGAPGWHIAILNTPERRTEFGQKLPMAAAWIGLQRDMGIWRWLNPSDEVQSSTGSPWASGEPMFGNDQGVFDSTNQSNLFRTGTSTDTKQFLCEYRP